MSNLPIKIHILFKFKDGPWGGGNQFLKALRLELRNQGVYTDDPAEANIILFNSYPFGAEYLFTELFQLKKDYPEKIIVYRVDGPISLIRTTDTIIDKIISLFSNIFVDGIIFQSTWSSKKNKKLFKIHSKNEITIINASNNLIFNKNNKKAFKHSGKIRIIATSWSGGENKGFDTYKFLDNHLDFDTYEFIFVGNTPPKFSFKNIQHIKPLPSKELSIELKKSDIFITASKNDPCSNSLIEALSCGLPAIVLNDGGHPEIVKGGGEIFDIAEEVIPKIEMVVKDYSNYQNKLLNYNIHLSTKSYVAFAKNIYLNHRYSPKKMTLSRKILFIYLQLLILKWKMENAITLLKNNPWKK